LNTFILNDDERDIAEFLVGIDDMGYIRRSVPDIVDDMALHKDFTLMKLP
jgi:RNA polymerase sigma-54 factor